VPYKTIWKACHFLKVVNYKRGVARTNAYLHSLVVRSHKSITNFKGRQHKNIPNIAMSGHLHASANLTTTEEDSTQFNAPLHKIHNKK